VSLPVLAVWLLSSKIFLPVIYDLKALGVPGGLMFKRGFYA